MAGELLLEVVEEFLKPFSLIPLIFEFKGEFSGVVNHLLHLKLGLGLQLLFVFP